MYADRAMREVVALTMSVCALLVGFVTVAYASGDANRPICGANTEASPGFRTYLPDCRAYELVSPPFRQGGIPMDGPAAVAPDGEAVIGSYAGATAGIENEPDDPVRGGDIGVYRLQRSGAGWSVTALTPAAVSFERSVLVAVSGDAGLMP